MEPKTNRNSPEKTLRNIVIGALAGVALGTIYLLRGGPEGHTQEFAHQALNQLPMITLAGAFLGLAYSRISGRI